MGFYVGEKTGFQSHRGLKKGRMNKVSDWSGKWAARSNDNLCIGTSGHKDCGAAKGVEAFVTSENKRLLLLRGRVTHRK